MTAEPIYLIAPPVAPVFDLALPVVDNIYLSATTNVLIVDSPEIAPHLKAGQFLNVKANDLHTPLLRRPLSVHRVDGNRIEMMIRIVGTGTEILYHAKPGDRLQTLAPLGNTFGYASGDFEMGLLVSGGIGVAPMAMLEAELKRRGIEVINFLGARTAEDIVTRHLSHCEVATDDGSLGFKGNVVALLETHLPRLQGKRLKVFACGPNRMLDAVARFCTARRIACEISIESIMGCGIGICYGCPVRLKGADGEAHNHLLCRVGSVIDARDIAFEE